VAAARSMKKGKYVPDTISPTEELIRRVDDHFFSQAVLGWVAPSGAPSLPLPGTMRPRHAVGVDASGRTHSVVCATTGCDLWTRTSATWTILDDAGGTTTVTTTGLVGESITFS
jgi:hypothetical protein